MPAIAFRISTADNVATLLTEADAGTAVALRGEGAGVEVQAIEPIRVGHKIALRQLEPGDVVVKYGQTIGEITASVAPGAWVHLHNCRSRFDAGSSELALETGERSGTRYA